MNAIDRYLSWIDFNGRVLAEACNDSVPLLERLKFIGIVSSNFDEFFMVRVAALKELARTGTEPEERTELTVKQQLHEIAVKTQHLFEIQENELNTRILPSLKKHGLIYLKPTECSAAQLEYLENYFRTELQPELHIEMLTDTDDLADTVTNIQVHAGFLLRRKKNSADCAAKPCSGTPAFEDEQLEDRLALIRIPSNKSGFSAAKERFIFFRDPVTGEKTEPLTFVLIDEVITFFGYLLFPEYTIAGTGIFKINRSASMTADDSNNDRFLEALENVLVQRKHSFAVRMTCTFESPVLVRRMTALFGLERHDIYESIAPIGLGSFSAITAIQGFNHLRYPQWKPHEVSGACGKKYWKQLKKKDMLLCVPYQSYTPVLQFLKHAAADPQVRSIYMTLYRTSKNSTIIRTLGKAAQRGKEVTVFVEVKARFDEERNISLVRYLESSGVKVLYDIPHFKVHAKIILVIRQEKSGSRGYVHLSTGNYNEITAQQYSDISLFTAHPHLAADAQLFFSHLRGGHSGAKTRMIITAPESLKDFLLEHIERERSHAAANKPAHIIAKMNNLSHPELIAALYAASQAGVRIDLNVRGICMLEPGKPGISDNIRVVSIIDRYLEHSRIIYFENGGNPEWYLSSADWMPRNLEKRIELLFPVLDTDNRRMLAHLMQTYFADNTKASELKTGWDWERCTQDSAAPVRAQEALYAYFAR